MRIAIDAGHGPDTPGKRCPDDSMREYQFNSEVARHLKDQLAGYAGVETMFTHSDSLDVPLKDRTDKANLWGADLFVSIHANAMGSNWNDAQGIETYVYTSRPPAAVSLATNVQRILIQSTGLPDRGVKTEDFHVLRETHMTAILAECGFMTNPREAELLKTGSFRTLCAAAIAKGIAVTYSLTPNQQVEASFMNDSVQEITSQLNQLSAQVAHLQEQNAMTVPDWAQAAVEAARQKGWIDSPEEGSYDFYRILTILHRIGVI